jgi:hypothetical protein
MLQDSHLTVFSAKLLLVALAIHGGGAYAQDGAVAASGWRHDNAVEAATLAPQGVGVWSAEDRGLRADLWNDMPFGVWMQMVNTMPAGIVSPTLRELAIDTLFVQGFPPTPSQDTPVNNTALRASAAAAISDSTAWQSFVVQIPLAERSEIIDARAADLQFTEKGPALCAGDAKPALPIWAIYCLLATGKAAEAQVQADALREGAQSIIELDTVDQVIAGSAPQLPSTPTVAAVRIASLAPAMGLNISSDIPLVERVLRFIAVERGGQQAPDAAEWLADRGFITAEKLGEVYLTTSFDEAALADPATTANRLRGGLQRAFLWQQASAASKPAEQVRLLAAMVESAGAAGVMGERGRLLGGFINTIPATPENTWAAPALFALATLQSEPVAQQAWYAATTALADKLPPATQWLVRMWPLAMVTGVSGTRADELPVWFGRAQALSDSERLPLADILILLQAGGVAVPADVLQAARASATPSEIEVDTRALGSLRAAAGSATADASHQAEVVLRSAVLAKGIFSRLPASAQAAVVQALRTVGLEDDATALLVEALAQRLYPGT